MKRWVWLGLLGGAVACTKVPDRDPPVSEEVCPGTEALSLPGTARQSLNPLAGEDGAEPVLITYRPRVSASAVSNLDTLTESARRVGAQVHRRFPHLNTIAAKVSPEARRALEQDPDVLRVEPDRVVRAFGMPSPLSPSLLQGVLPNTSGSTGEYTAGLHRVQAPQVWDANNDGVLDDGAPSGTGIKVCIIDSGWDNRHPELAAAYLEGKDFLDGDDEPLDQGRVSGVLKWGGGHGTHTAATIAAQLGAGAHVRPGEEPNGVAGVAPTVSLLVARVLDVNGDGNTSNVIAAMDWCIERGAHIASLSLGSIAPSQTEEAAFQRAFDAGMVAIAATGNRGTEEKSYPAGYENVIAVGAIDANNAWAPFSQYGKDFVSLVAPGVGILSATIVGGAPYGDVDVGGTRFASEPLEYTGVGKYAGRMVYCGLGERVSSCGEGATCDGFVALVDRGGGILFKEKALNAIRAGAKAIVVGNNTSEDGAGNFTLTDPEDFWVPTTSVTLVNANTLKGLVGQDVTVDVSGLDYLRQSGTSMATPHVAGVAALVLGACPRLTHVQVREVLEKTALDLGEAGKDIKFGHGLVQAKAAVDEARRICPPPAP